MLLQRFTLAAPAPPPWPTALAPCNSPLAFVFDPKSVCRSIYKTSASAPTQPSLLSIVNSLLLAEKSAGVLFMVPSMRGICHPDLCNCASLQQAPLHDQKQSREKGAFCRNLAKALRCQLCFDHGCSSTASVAFSFTVIIRPHSLLAVLLLLRLRSQLLWL